MLSHTFEVTESSSLESLFFRRLLFASVGAVMIALLWLSVRSLTDHCYLYLHGPSAVAATVALLAGWMFMFLAGNKTIRTSLLVMTFIAVALTLPTETNISGSASSFAASELRRTAAKLEDAHSNSAIDAYPATVSFFSDSQVRTNRFYKFDYVAVRSNPNGPIDAFHLKARPLRYACGISAAFLVDSKGKFHVTHEDRDATEGDPLLD
jgi:hypothetical protein